MLIGLATGAPGGLGGEESPAGIPLTIGDHHRTFKLERFQRPRHMPALFLQKITVLGQRRPGVCIDSPLESLFMVQPFRRWLRWGQGSQVVAGFESDFQLSCRT